jgi:penicillin-binding protein 2
MFGLYPYQLNRRAFLRILGVSGFAVILEACDAFRSTPTAPAPLATPTRPPPLTAEATAREFLDAWTKEDYAAMYQLLAPGSQAGITQDDFVKRYQAAMDEATVIAAQPHFVSILDQSGTATVQFQTSLDTAMFGVIEEDNALALVLESNRWGIVWSSGNILKDLGESNILKLYPSKSTRGNIYDRNGQPIAIGQKAILVSLWPAEMRRNQAEARVLASLEPILNLSQFDIQRRYANANPEWKIPIATVSTDVARANADALSLPGVVTEEQDARAYPQGAAAAHIAGYVGQINADELAQVYDKGYREGDYLGRAGLERWGEKYLSGARGGRLAITTPDGQDIVTLKERPAQQSQSIFLTIDIELQNFVDSLLGNQRGSIVVMSVKNGDVLALVSRPSYDPNAFVDATRQRERQNILTSPQRLLLNRATQGAYPLGSVYKIVTLATALERGGLGQFTPFTCNGVWNGLGYAKACWIWAYGRTHGTIGLQRALTVSCDITFYQVGLILDRKDPGLMPSFAYSFGLGAATGIGIEEGAGNVPDPKKQQPWIPTDPVDMAIGQDTFLVSPLQVADFVAGVANGGTLWKPRLVSRIQDLANGTEQALASEKRGDLPASAKTLQVIREALKGVTTDKDGTAKFAFEGLPVISAGKTGTAQVPGKNEPHAWFAGYAPADNPEIACVVMVENGGEGSKTAAPLFRRVVEKYFHVQPTPTPPKPKAVPTATPPPSE